MWVRFGFYLFLLASLVLVPAAIGLLDELGADSTAARSVAAFGVLGAFAQMLGWVRWPIAVPGLADAWTDPTATDTQREATAAAYDVLNGYAGGALGEHLGWLLQGIWAVGVALLALRSARVPRWFATLGLIVAGAWAIAVPTATQSAGDLGVMGSEPVHRVVPVAHDVRLLLLRRSPSSARQPGGGVRVRRGASSHPS